VHVGKGIGCAPNILLSILFIKNKLVEVGSNINGGSAFAT
jgi:hypothetical protein